MNWKAIFVAALIPVSVGMIWYNGKVFGKSWMNEIKADIEKLRGNSPGKLMFLTFVFSIFIAMALNPMVIHQMGAESLISASEQSTDPTIQQMATQDMQHFKQAYGNDFRTFKHGALHGFLYGLFLLFPIIAINAMYELRSWKYIMINSGFWSLCMLLMGGIISAWV